MTSMTKSTFSIHSDGDNVLGCLKPPSAHTFSPQVLRRSLDYCLEMKAGPSSINSRSPSRYEKAILS